MRRCTGAGRRFRRVVANIDLDRVRRALFKADGNITQAAKALKVKSADLRRLTWRHPTLIMDALEHAHRMVDKAEEKLIAALDGDHPERSLRASLFILSHSAAARERGWGRHGGDSDYLYSPPAAAPVVVIWQGDARWVIGRCRRLFRRRGVVRRHHCRRIPWRTSRFTDSRRLGSCYTCVNFGESRAWPDRRLLRLQDRSDVGRRRSCR